MSIKERYANIISVLTNFSDDPVALQKDYSTGFYNVIVI